MHVRVRLYLQKISRNGSYERRDDFDRRRSAQAATNRALGIQLYSAEQRTFTQRMQERRISSLHEARRTLAGYASAAKLHPTHICQHISIRKGGRSTCRKLYVNFGIAWNCSFQE